VLNLTLLKLLTGDGATLFCLT